MAAGLDPALAYAAGALTILSPCVLPLVPVVLAGAGRTSRWGPLALAGGLIATFTAAGLSLAALGAATGLDGEVFRMIGAALLVGVGAVLLVPRLQDGLARAAAPLTAWAGARQSGLERFGLAGQAGIGALLGLVWSPCVGPTLGAATVLAAQGRDLGQAGVVMAGFAAGVASVLLVVAALARRFAGLRGNLAKVGGGGKALLGVLIVAVGVSILTGVDKVLEGLLVAVTPPWLTDLTTSL